MVTIIYDVNDLQAMNLDLSADYELGNDIDASPTQEWNYIDTEPAWWNSAVLGTFAPYYSGFEPIGDTDNKFEGNFDGKNFTISGLHISRGTKYNCLFGAVGLYDSGPTLPIIKNIIFDNANIDSKYVYNSTDGYGVSGIFGLVYYATIENVIIKNSFVSGVYENDVIHYVGLFAYIGRDGSIIRNCKAINCDLKDTPRCGGIIYYVYAADTIENCAMIGCTVGQGSTISTYAGGFAYSIQSGTIRNCYVVNTDVYGSYGLSGFAFYAGSGTTIKNVYTSCNLIDDGSTSIAGLVESGLPESIENSYWDTETTGQSTGIRDDPDGSTYPTVVGLTTAEMKDQSNYIDWDFNRGSGEWLIHSDVNDGYPELQALRTPYGDMAGGYGVESSPYQIADVNQLQAMNEDLSAYYELINDIDASDTENWNGGEGFETIGSYPYKFEGVLNGRYYTIKSLYINRPTTNNIGLFYRFSSIYSNQIKNIILQDFKIYGNGNTGIVAGMCYNGNPKNVHVVNGFVSCGYLRSGLFAGSIQYTSVINCSATGIVDSRNSRAHRIGGFTGEFRGSGNVYKVSNIFSNVKLINNKSVARNNALFAGRISVLCDIENVVVTGDYKNVDNPSGFVGDLLELKDGSEFIFNNCYFNNFISDTRFEYIDSGTGYVEDDFVGVIHPKLEEQLTYPYKPADEVYQSWDFETIWKEDDKGLNDGYPILRSRYGDLIEYKVKHNDRWIVPKLFGEQEYITINGNQINNYNPNPNPNILIVSENVPQNIKDVADYIATEDNINYILSEVVNDLTPGRTWKETIQFIGDFYPTTGIEIPSFTHIDCTNAYFYWDETDPLFTTNNTGTVINSTDITTNVARGDRTITVTDSSIFEIDDFVMIRSERDDETSLHNDYMGKYAEIFQIVDIPDSTTIEISGMSNLPYDTTDSAAVDKLDMTMNVSITGGYYEGLSSTQDKNVLLLRFWKCANFDISNMQTNNLAYMSISMMDCVEGQVHHNNIHGSSKAGLGYGIGTSRACSKIKIHSNILSHCRHHIVGGIGSGTYGIPQDIMVNDNLIIGGNLSTAIDLHQCRAYGMQYNNNIITGCKNGIGVGAAQWSARGNYVKVINGNHAINIRLNPTEYIDVSDNTIVGGYMNLYSIRLEKAIISNNIFIEGDGRILTSTNVADSDILISGNSIVSSGNVTNPLIDVTGFGNILIDGNTVKNADINGINIKGATTGMIQDNIVHNYNLSGSAVDQEASGICLEDSTGIIVKGNSIGEASGNTNQINGVTEIGTSDTNKVLENIFENIQTNEIILVGAGSLYNNNYINGECIQVYEDTSTGDLYKIEVTNGSVTTTLL